MRTGQRRPQYDNVPVGKNHGPEGLRTFLQMMMGGFEQVEFVILRQTVAGDIVMNERVDRFRVGEQWLDLPVAGVFEIDEAGKIVLWRDYFDMAMFTSELAKLAPPA
ncbi:MAG: putative limonene,2-epoxide hydrolase [Ilumatobacteraceae bacterium]|nr:putative limonene,2-epoxide hydrolase [Ilumatobacteraceae bacterium]